MLGESQYHCDGVSYRIRARNTVTVDIDYHTHILLLYDIIEEGQLFFCFFPFCSFGTYGRMIEDSKSKSKSKSNSKSTSNMFWPFELHSYRIGNDNQLSARIGFGTLEEKISKLERLSFELLKIEPLTVAKA